MDEWAYKNRWTSTGVDNQQRCSDGEERSDLDTVNDQRASFRGRSKEMPCSLLPLWLCLDDGRRLLGAPAALPAGETGDWWNPQWRMRTTISRTAPYRDNAPRAVEAAIDFPLLLERAGVAGQFDPRSLRVIRRDAKEGAQLVPFAYRTESAESKKQWRSYLAWTAKPKVGQVAAYDVYFDTTDRNITPAEFDSPSLPPANLLTNAGFEEVTDELPAGWTCSPTELDRVVLRPSEHWPWPAATAAGFVTGARLL